MNNDLNAIVHSVVQRGITFYQPMSFGYETFFHFTQLFTKKNISLQHTKSKLKLNLNTSKTKHKYIYSLV